MDDLCNRQVDLYIITSICLVAYILSSLHTSHVHAPYGHNTYLFKCT